MKRLLLKIKSTVLGVIIGIIAGVALLLSGCGADKTDEDNIRVIETIDENGEVSGVIDAAEAAAKGALEDNSEDANEIAEENDAAATGDNSAEGEDSYSRNIEIVSGDRDYLQYMSEEEITELAAEALKNAGLDASLAEGKLKTKGITYELPEGFFESEENGNMFVTKRYPIDASNIIYMELPVDYTLQMMEKDYFENLVETAFLSSADKSIDIKITEFTKKKINGVPAFRLKAEYDYEDQHITHLMYIINGSQTYVLVYTMTHDYDRMEIFEESAATIKVLK